MASYKDFITNPGMPKKSDDVSASKLIDKPSDDLVKKIKEVDKYLEKLKQDEIIMKRNKDILESFDKISGKNKEVIYLQIYEIYKKYKDFEMQKDIMQTRIINTIKNYYNKQLREEAAKKKTICPQNNHVMEENWTNNNGLWIRRCKICGYPEKSYTKPITTTKAPTRTRKKSPKDNK